MPPIQYARSDDLYIAYRSFGTGDDVLFTSAATITMDFIWGPMIQEIAQHSRVTWYDKRGIGASDGAANFTFEERMDDIRAVMDAAGIEGAHLTGASEGGPMSILFASTYPERVKSLTLYGTYPSCMRRPGYPYGFDLTVSGWSRWVDRIVASQAGDREAAQWFWNMWSPTLAADPAFLDLVSSAGSSTSPSAARLIWESMYEVDVRSLLPALRVPTTIVHRTGDRVAPVEGARYLAEHIPGAKLIETVSDDHFSIEPIREWIDAVIDNVEHAAERPSASVDRRLATVLFTDIVDSTPSASKAGDRAWTELLDRHDSVARGIIAEHRGHLVKTTGDGLLATFDGPSRAVSCALALHAAMDELDLPIRAGLHAGEIEIRHDDIAGIAVHIAARISGLASAHQTMVSSTVKDLVAGSGFTFSDRGEQQLKGVEQPWRCYSLEPTLAMT
jgi:class 3 adenylate cyclase